ncbi:hypothetical protein Bca52824_017851 [Brassica carinata]|uniref:Uncharacterized protein n=1 Tax=Brassica carinata TaxID=52824 RepID=A0A8X7VNE0_BRACI|nr:hypothetical protein Bca52824_017851 [Brassica carinata]
MFYHVLDGLDDFNSVWPSHGLAGSVELSMALVGQLSPDLIVLDGIDGIRPWIPLNPVQAGWWLVLDGSEWPCAVLDVRIVIDEYPGSDQDRGKAKQP